MDSQEQEAIENEIKRFEEKFGAIDKRHDTNVDPWKMPKGSD